ncbi:MAG: hypothetical protein K2K29_03710 [Muribaculaceae bacterium]|nr:hypothetical protein [Muribaculaceae bacterium]
MKKISTILIMILAMAESLCAAEAKKPKLMVFPSDDWCVAHGYTLPGTRTPDYEKALLNPDMDAAVAVMGDIMAEMGYEMFSLKQELKNIHNSDAYSMVVTSKNDGMVRESDRDVLTRNVACDFIVELSIEPKPFGARKMVEFKAQTIDAASNKILSGYTGTSSASSQPVAILIKEAVGGFIDNFCHKIDLAFTKMERDGREGSVEFKIADDCPLHFENEVSINGESGELAEYIEYVLGECAVDGAYNLKQKSRETLSFDQVRFPLFATVRAGGFGSKSGKVKAQTMESFIKNVTDKLSPLGISATIVPKGQGAAYVVLGATAY